MYSEIDSHFNTKVLFNRATHIYCLVCTNIMISVILFLKFLALCLPVVCTWLGSDAVGLERIKLNDCIYSF